MGTSRLRFDNISTNRTTVILGHVLMLGRTVEWWTGRPDAVGRPVSASTRGTQVRLESGLRNVQPRSEQTLTLR